MRLFDTHAHLLDAQFDEDRNALIPALLQDGVARVVEACCEERDIARIRALVILYDHIYGSAGIHPQSAASASEIALRHVQAALMDEKIVAVGEIGLDYHYEYAPRQVQKDAFDAQLSIACQANKPVVIHDREAHHDTMELIRSHPGARGVLHCYSGSYEDACRYIDMGFYIAFGGALTFKNAARQREIAARLPLDCLVLETDCPYMTPEPHRGKRNDPSLMRLTLSTLAAVRALAEETVAEALWENANALYGLNG